MFQEQCLLFKKRDVRRINHVQFLLYGTVKVWSAPGWRTVTYNNSKGGGKRGKKERRKNSTIYRRSTSVGTVNARVYNYAPVDVHKQCTTIKPVWKNGLFTLFMFSYYVT